MRGGHTKDEPDEQDPVLAAMEYLERFRSSPWCWDVGGPAAVDDYCIVGVHRWAGARVRLEYDYQLPDSRRPLHGVARRCEVPPAGKERVLLSAFRRALLAGDRYAFAEDGSAAGLCAAVAQIPGVPPEFLPRVAEAVAEMERGAQGEGFQRHFSHRYRAEVVRGACVGVRFRGAFRQFLAVLPAGDTGWELSHVPGGKPSLGLVIACVGGGMFGPALFGARVDGSSLIGSLVGTALVLWCFRANRWWLYGRLRKALTPARCRPAPLPLIAITGPDADTSSLLYSLVVHLAAHAQLADPAEGGLLLDDTYEELAAMLHAPQRGPAWSSTCRLQLGDGRRVRLVHVAAPPGGQLGELHRQVLARADRVCVALPAGAPMGWAEEIGRVPVSVFSPAGGLDAAALRDRYLAGDVSPEEAAGLVRWVLEGDEPAPSRPANLIWRMLSPSLSRSAGRQSPGLAPGVARARLPRGRGSNPPGLVPGDG